jgi:Ca2+-binding EF-hand superfamily protein
MKRHTATTCIRLTAIAWAATLCLSAQPAPAPAPWSAFDLNDDGSVTAEEFAAASTSMVEGLKAQFLETYDTIPAGATAGDGIILPEESLAVHQAAAADWLEDLLKVYDKNGDGVISSADKTRRGKGGNLRHLLADYDTDDDGTISQAELVAAAEAKAQALQDRFLAKYDTVPEGEDAGDGTITAEESLAVFQAIIQAKVDAVLERYDADEDGIVTAEEIEAVEGNHHRGKPGGRKGRGHPSGA